MNSCPTCFSSGSVKVDLLHLTALKKSVPMKPVTTPTLLLDKQKCRDNIRKMAEKARKSGIALVPHFKTHQSLQVGEWFREVGVEAITVTSVKMARYFANGGWKDITVAMPVNVREVEEINALAARVNLHLFITSKETVMLLKKKLTRPVRFSIEIDAGYHRSGVPADKTAAIHSILDASVGSQLNFEGFYTHAGHTYDGQTKEEIKQLYRQTVTRLNTLKEAFQPQYPNLKLSLGDTPSCSIINDFTDVDNIRPGNFVYYDLKQHSVGSNTTKQIALCLAVPVLEVHPDRGEVVTHSGWAHLGKDSLKDEDGTIHYGKIVLLTESGWKLPVPGGYVSKVSQEHGILTLPDSVMQQVKVGDVLGVLPVHACATALMMGQLFTLEGESINTMN